MVEIPPEIVELFFYHLNATNNRKTYLKTCCLVSQQWRLISQPLLFSIIRLDTAVETVERIQSLAKAVTLSPHLIPYVDLFRICDPSDSARAVARVVAKVNPRVLEVWWTITEAFRVGELHSNVLSILPSLLSSTRLTSLHLYNIRNFPVTLFRHCAILQVLSFKSCTLSETDQTVTDSRLIRPKLHCLTLTVDRHTQEEILVLEWCTKPYCGLDFSELKVFSNRSTPLTDSYQHVYHFVRIHGRCLEVISIDTIHIYRSPTTAQFPAEQLHHLRSLNFRLSLAGRQTAPLFLWITSLLTNLPRPHLLTRLCLECLFHVPGRPRSDVRVQKWGEVDRVLGLPAFANLKSVVIVCEKEMGDVLFEELKRNLLALLPVIVVDSRKVVSIVRTTRPRK
ncbi:hypothetical protein BDN72DRAFT_842585 [Pluteus cervinus]|uniref:Uncharacterized protein n=1 Tax=Pluteus cervinus TaxID=181527 RepID=A0ACD3AQ17_9AGAR|nr:hypothetical protein BDN72DRAFT_842585 [Pluteus cervinus]